MVNHQQSFDHFMEQREAAAAAYVRGDAQPLDRIIVRGLPASFFAPTGGYVTGADKVACKYGNDASQFGLNGGSCFEVFDAAAGAEIAYWTGIQHAKV